MEEGGSRRVALGREEYLRDLQIDYTSGNGLQIMVYNGYEEKGKKMKVA